MGAHGEVGLRAGTGALRYWTNQALHNSNKKHSSTAPPNDAPTINSIFCQKGASYSQGVHASTAKSASSTVAHTHKKVQVAYTVQSAHSSRTAWRAHKATCRVLCSEWGGRCML